MSNFHEYYTPLIFAQLSCPSHNSDLTKLVYIDVITYPCPNPNFAGSAKFCLKKGPASCILPVTLLPY